MFTVTTSGRGKLCTMARPRAETGWRTRWPRIVKLEPMCCVHAGMTSANVANWAWRRKRSRPKPQAFGLWGSRRQTGGTPICSRSVSGVELAGELASGHQVGRPLSVGHRPVVAGRCPRAGDQAMPITGCLGRDKRCARTSRCRALPNSDAGPTPPCSSANHRQSRPQRPERPDMDALITLEFQSDPALIDGY